MRINKRKPHSGSKGLAFVMTLMLSMTLIGCEPPRILDETGLITVIGFDQLEKKRIRGTAAIPVVNSMAKQKVQIISGTETTLRGILNDLDFQLDRKPRLGQMRVAIFNEDMAKNGIIRFVGGLDRTEVGSRPYLAVVRGKSYDLVNASFQEQGNIGLYLYYSIFKNVRGEQLISPTLHEFLRAYYSEGSDPCLPYLERKGDDIKILGLALFKDDRFVDWIKPHQSFYIKLIRDQFRTGTFQTTLPKHIIKARGYPSVSPTLKVQEVPVVLDTIASKSKVKLTSVNPPAFDVEIKIRSRLSEIGIKTNLESTQVLNQLNHGIEKKMEKEMEQLIKFLQQKEIDPIGFGEQFRAQTRAEELKKEEWRKRYKQAKFTFRVHNDIIRTSITD
ncbi:Ger(x)C family spore germination protein [Brevibacillus brevis]|uniref:Ger(X)C family spore germination protein n=1 Tax=Brevibacillus brevis TaxID=1393 RepID=A0ABY9TCH3_BREBE|nr:Ger(x)C family spore germination protein [Brevibacillus brevis]WNC17569.1 Ger(x)C family spore germination protein [Brevibacillus brevis]